MLEDHNWSRVLLELEAVMSVSAVMVDLEGNSSGICDECAS